MDLLYYAVCICNPGPHLIKLRKGLLKNGKIMNRPNTYRDRIESNDYLATDIVQSLSK